MLVERVGDHELRLQQPDAVDGHGRHLVGVVGDGEVDVEQRSRCLCRERQPGPGHRHRIGNSGGCAVTSAPARTTPFAPSTVTTRRRAGRWWPCVCPRWSGRWSSRPTIAAWQVTPPPSVTRAAARRIVGTQSGLVIVATSTSPRGAGPRPPGCAGCGPGPWRCRARRPSRLTSTPPTPSPSGAADSLSRVVIGRTARSTRVRPRARTRRPGATRSGPRSPMPCVPGSGGCHRRGPAGAAASPARAGAGRARPARARSARPGADVDLRDTGPSLDST